MSVNRLSNFSKLLIVLIAIILLLFVRQLTLDQVVYPDEIDAPLQSDLKVADEIRHTGKEGEVLLFPKAEYTLKGVVKSKKKYSDYPSQISSYDLALAWGELNDEEIEDFITYSQSGRWYYYRYKSGTPVSGDYIAEHSANVHIIHKNEEILDQLNNIKEGDFILLKGYLVDVDFTEIQSDSLWKTSLTRSDTGDGACEILYVESVTIID